MSACEHGVPVTGYCVQCDVDAKVAGGMDLPDGLLPPELVAKVDRGEADADAALQRVIGVYGDHIARGKSRTTTLLATTVGLEAAVKAQGVEVLCGMLAVAVARLYDVREAKKR
ncbi:hypothetical protein SEA_WEST99_65 [Mycobacterium phage West99]|uniref:Uncharacterized protein n=3 Tax=Rosebushvirus rosebush TaxID=2006145 RepID=A0A5P8DB73_9CAUD|nr:hypothetical protein SEA_KHETH_65 [Mycobacterium phage Kheth]QFP96258.1 hypothetical protein SEA_WEST99_65 [Mycobacterium phage West99]QWY80988.1 hypothetical protein SEA_LARS_66 [Mycobacterium phage Lars]